MKGLVFKTAFQKEKEARDRAIYDDFIKMSAIKGASRTAVVAHLMEKYNVHSTTGIYAPVRRVKKELEEKQTKK